MCSGEAMSHGLIQKAMVSELFLVVALTMVLTPLLAEIGQRLSKAFEKSDVKVHMHPALNWEWQALQQLSCQGGWWGWKGRETSAAIP